jgi:hypothetical protein
MLFWLYFKAFGKHWWALMSCAAFTILGFYVAWANKSNEWTVRGIFGIALGLLIVAGFLAWRDEFRRANDLEAKLRDIEASPRLTPVQNIYLPAQQISPELKPPKHNVQCLGVEIEDICLTIAFQNIPIPGEPVGDFKSARLCIEYMDRLTGIPVATVFPARWIEESHDSSVGLTPRRAFLASFFGGDRGWRALPEVEGVGNLSYQERIDGLALRSGCLLVRATLVGEKKPCLGPDCRVFDFA